MVQLQRIGVQEHALQTQFLQAAVRLVVAVTFVARNRTAARPHVDADLVRAPRFQRRLHQT